MSEMQELLNNVIQLRVKHDVAVATVEQQKVEIQRWMAAVGECNTLHHANQDELRRQIRKLEKDNEELRNEKGVLIEAMDLFRLELAGRKVENETMPTV